MDIFWFLAGAALSAPLWIGIALLACRRIWLSARRMSSRAKGQNQLVELGQIAAGLAHELKNPLSTINLNLKLLVEDLGVFRDEAHARAIRRLDGVRDEARRLNDILGDFLRFAGKHELQLSPVDLRSVLDELADFFNPQTQAAQVVLRLSTPDVPVICMIDANLLKQAVLNLMINAVDAMSSGGELLLKLSVVRGRALLEVIDTGPGIPEQVLDRIFDVYYSTKKNGSGLGLPTSRRIVREHDGALQVQSEEGKGTRFIITLPCVKR
ncbi:MAG: two-component sensor histidine kinase [Planctomycetes bacterium]|jgi:two-component system sensor histidine kinase HydH|nr:two-component sensor histidine kinase [Planctomycetota bacterium]